MLGVFIGLQASNWNELRAANLRKNEAIQRLHDESERAVLYFQDRVARAERANGARSEVLQRLADDNWKDADFDYLRQGITSTYYLPFVAPPRAIYDEMLANGLFGAIEDDGVRDAVSGYYSSLTVLEGRILYVRSNREDFKYWPREGVSFDYWPDNEAELLIDFDFEALKDDEDFNDRLLIGNASQRSITYLLRYSEDRAKEMCAAIATISERPCTALVPNDDLNQTP